MRLENTFDVPAPIDEAWALLTDVPRVVPCMPGAELTEVVGDEHWKATIHVKLGPIALRFAADVTRERMDEAAGTTTLTAKARELKGRGGAEATVESRLQAVPDGTRVSIATDLALKGAVAQYGRGIVADVSDQLVKQFAARLAAELQSAPGAAAPAAGPAADEVAGADATGSDAAAPPVSPHAAAAPVEPVGGLGLFLRAVCAPVLRLFSARRRDARRS